MCQESEPETDLERLWRTFRNLHAVRRPWIVLSQRMILYDL